jgi:hypothetical protein
MRSILALLSALFKGFKPLNTEDIDALDDVTTDESDQEDTLYASKPKAPLKT